jgi:ribonuclease I
MSIAGIPSLRGPPDLISSRGTVCCEKSVWGHSARRLNGSAVALPTVIAAKALTAATISTVVRMQFPNLNGSPLRISILSQRLQIAICVDFDLHYSLDRPTRLLVRVTFSLTEVRLSCSQHG